MNTISKILVAAAVLVSGISVAQETTDLTVTLGDSYNITVNQATVGIAMNTPTHFINGNSIEQANHLTVTASRAYTVQVTAEEANFSPASGNDVIAVSNVLIAVTGAGVNTTSTATLSDPLPLSNAAQTIIGSNGGDITRHYPVSYTIPSANAPSFLNKTATTYTTTLTYSIIPN